MPGLSSNNEITWEYIDQNESEFLYYEIFINKSYFYGLTLSEGDLIIDAGANIGLFSLYCLSKLKNLKICAFEPIQPIYDVLKRNLNGYFQNNNQNDLKLFNFALGSKNEMNQLFYYFPSAPGESTRNIQERNLQKYRIEQSLKNNPNPLAPEIGILQQQQQQTETISNHKRKISDVHINQDLNNYDGAELHTVNIVTLPTIMKQIYGDNWYVDLLKVDVEGDEWNVLQGLVTSVDAPTDPLTNHIRQIVLEVHDKPLDTLSLLTQRNGRLSHITEFLQYHGYIVNVEQQLPKVCDGTDYYMYIPPELNLYYVYATQNEAKKPQPLVNSVPSSNALTNEDFDTLFAVLNDDNIDFDPMGFRLDSGTNLLKK